MASTSGREGAGPIYHGGRLAQARARFPGAPEPFLDLSTGINPAPYPMPPLHPDVFARLPEPETVEAVERAAALAYGVSDPAMVVAAPGTQILISLLPHLRPLASVAVLGPTYAEHGASWRAGGAEVREVSDLERLGEAHGAVLCNPNNPDGRRIPPAALRALADQLAERGGLMVVDEAFADLEGEGLSLAPTLPHPAILILRSFGKTYGLAGLRLGFALAAPDLADRLRRALGPWAVSGPALAAAEMALADRNWLRRTQARLDDSVARLDASLKAAGLTVIGGTRLIRLAQTPHTAELFEHLGRAGILVRAFPDYPYWLRFGLPADEAQWARLEEALAPFQSASGHEAHRQPTERVG